MGLGYYLRQTSHCPTDKTCSLGCDFRTRENHRFWVPVISRGLHLLIWFQERRLSANGKPNGHAVEVEQPIVACLIPCYRTLHPRMQHSFAAMVDYTRKQGIKVIPQPVIQASVVHWVRNSLLATLIQSRQPFTHVLFIDDDIVVQQDFLLRLLKHNVDVVAGLCTRRQDPPIPNARLYHKESKRFEELWEWPDGLVEVGAVGTGLMLISRHALQQSMEIYLQCVHEKVTLGMPEDRAAIIQEERTKAFDEDANGWWFRFLSCENGVGELGEDIGFCWALNKYAGIKIHVDTMVQPEHMGDYGYSIRDFIDHRDPLIADAKRKGRYIAPPSLIAPPRDRIHVIEG